jgi:signal peptidase
VTTLRRTVSTALQVGAILVLASPLLGQALGMPVLLSYVETGSMNPTLSPGDGFVAVPAQLAGPVEEGDVVVFEAKKIQGGGLTTHRVVDETDRGFITRGDANPFTDQDGGEPPVKRAQVLAVALQFGGTVISVPHVGTLTTGVSKALSTVQQSLAAALGTRSVLGTQGLAYLFFAVSMVYLAVGEYRDDGTEERKTDRRRNRDDGLDERLIVAAFALLVVVTATLAMVVPAGTQEYGVVSAEFDSERPTVIPVGTTGTVEYVAHNGGLVPVRVYLEPASEGVSVDPGRVRVSSGETVRADVRLSAPPETGYYRRYLVEHRYLAVLPASVTDALYEFHPWAPLLVVDAVVGGTFLLLGTLPLGGRRMRSRSRSRAR